MINLASIFTITQCLGLQFTSGHSWAPMAAVGLHPADPGHQWLHDPLHHQAAVQDIP